jgi:ABC-2 type transport system ATP-binding protein
MIGFLDATLAFGDRRALDGVSFEVPAGRTVAIIGRTGAGKSTLLAAAAAAVPLSGGDITVGGHSVRRDPAAVRRLVGYVPCRPPSWPPARVGEFLDAAALSAGLVGKPLRLAVGKALDLAGLAGRTGDPIETLPDASGRRLLLARALLHDPEVLLLDDPFTALDPAERSTIEDMVGDAHLMGRIVLAAIDDAEVPACFTHLAMLEAGRITASAPADVTAFATGRRFTFRLTCPGRANDAAVAMRSVAADARAVDFDHAVAAIDPVLVPGSRLVDAAVAARIPVAAAGFHPSWTAQLLQ